MKNLKRQIVLLLASIFVLSACAAEPSEKTKEQPREGYNIVTVHIGEEITYGNNEYVIYYGGEVHFGRYFYTKQNKENAVWKMVSSYPYEYFYGEGNQKIYIHKVNSKTATIEIPK